MTATNGPCEFCERADYDVRTLRDELAAKAARVTELEGVLLSRHGGEPLSLMDELAECRAMCERQRAEFAKEVDRQEAKLAQSTEAIAYAEKVDAERAKMDAAKLAQADKLAVDNLRAYELSCRDLAASQANVRELREALEHFVNAFLDADGRLYRVVSPEMAKATLGITAALARPADNAALREMLTKADSEGFLAGMKAQQFVCGTYGITEADLVPDHVRVSSLLGGGK